MESLGANPCHCGGEFLTEENIGANYYKWKQYLLTCKKCGGTYSARNLLPEEIESGKLFEWGLDKPKRRTDV